MSDGIRDKALKRFDSRNFVVTPHAHLRMIRRGITLVDIRLILLHGAVEPQPKGRYKFKGWCMDKRDCQVVVEFENGMVVITVIGDER
jgi:hypothetical protein